jgi:hypothetical protein
MMMSVSNVNAYSLMAPIAAANYYNVEFSTGYVLRDRKRRLRLWIRFS